MAGSLDSSNKERSGSKVAFVAPTDLRCHSMLHQTLTPPFLQFPFHHHHHTISSAAAAGFLHPPPPPPPTATPPRASTQSMQGERESRSMEVAEAAAIKKARRQEAAPPEPLQQQQGFLLPDDMAWAAERGGLLGEEFSVDDLLDFEGLDTYKEAEEEGEDGTKGDAFLEEKEATTSAAGGSSFPAAPPPLSDINFPAHDAAEFEWMTSIMDDTVPEYPLCPGVAPYRPSSETAKAQFKTHRREPKQELGWAEYMPAPPSPAATIVCKLSTEDLVPVKAKRSKRPRTAGNSWPNLGAGTFTDSSATTTTSSPSSSCSSASSPSSTYFFVYDSHRPFLPSPPKKHQKPKKRGRKPKHHAAAFAAGEAVAGAAAGDRRCTHCGAQKTPQWRAGPAGPKTLCNACGVRYKSGRLVPEYRPAASPTFVGHVHSNSHRKVLEMRRKKEEQHVAAAAPAVATF